MQMEKTHTRLSDEQIKVFQACKTLEDVMSFVSSLDFELTDDDLEGIVGGSNWTIEHIDQFRTGLTR